MRAEPTPMGAPLAYLYCILSAARGPALGKVPEGLPGTTAPRIVEAVEGLWIVMADAPSKAYAAAAVEERLRDLDWVSACAYRHQSVVEGCKRHGTVLPLKLFTLFSTEDRAREYVRRKRRQFDRTVTRLIGREEWAVRVVLDPSVALDEARRRVVRPSRATTGAGFLARKKVERDARTDLVRLAREEAQRVFEDLGERAEDARVRPPTAEEAGTRVLLDAAFLVAAGRCDAFRSVVRGFAKKLGPRGYSIHVAGPWAPYHFVTEAR